MTVKASYGNINEPLLARGATLKELVAHVVLQLVNEESIELAYYKDKLEEDLEDLEWMPEDLQLQGYIISLRETISTYEDRIEAIRKCKNLSQLNELDIFEVGWHCTQVA